MSLADIKIRDPKAAFAIARTLPLEGGLVNNPKDPGGITDFGVSLRYALAEVKLHPNTIRFFDSDHDGHIDRKDISGLTPEAAADIFFNCWWIPGWYANLQPDLVAWKCFDIAVNTGPNRAALLLQKALGDVGSTVPVDASIGPKSVMAVAVQAAKDKGVALLAAVRKEQADFYRGLVAREPSLKQFQKGWLNRAAA